MSRRIVISLTVIVAMLFVAGFARWRIGLVSRASGTFGDRRMVFELRKQGDKIYLHTYGAGTSVRFFAEADQIDGKQSEITIDESTDVITISYGEVVQKFSVQSDGNVVPSD